MVYLLLVACYIRHYMYVCTMYIVQLCCCSGRDYWDIHWLHLQLWLPLYVTPNSGSPLVLIQSSCYVLKHSFHADPISCWQCFLLSNPGLCSRYGQQETFLTPPIVDKRKLSVFYAFDMCVALYSCVHCPFALNSDV